MNLLPFKPSIKFKAKNPKFAIYARLVSSAGAIVIGLLALAEMKNSFGINLMSLIIALFVLVVEIDIVPLQVLKQAQNRGGTFVILGALSTFAGGLGAFAGLILIAGGALYLVYYFN